MTTQQALLGAAASVGGGTTINLFITSDQLSVYNVRTQAGSPAGVVTVNVTIDDNVTCWAGIDEQAGWAVGSVINIIIGRFASVFGYPGTAGAGGQATPGTLGSPSAGTAGGDAVVCRCPGTFSNPLGGGVIGGGGGGGGGGGASADYNPPGSNARAGGGGGGGPAPLGSGAAGGVTTGGADGAAGSNGTSSGGGSGGNGGTSFGPVGGNGGTGGGLGQDGASGATGTGAQKTAGAAGGAAGYAIRKNSNAITVTGITVYGTVA